MLSPFVVLAQKCVTRTFVHSGQIASELPFKAKTFIFIRKELPMPRVLTFEEMRKLRTDQWIWVEIKGYSIEYTDGLYHLQINRYVSSYHIDCIDIITISVRTPTQTVLFETCDKGWRIWSDEPTQEQMEETSWDYSTWPAMCRCIDCANFNAEDYSCCDGEESMCLTAHYAKSYGVCGRFRLLEKEH